MCSEFITLGVRESEDLRSVVAHLRAGGRVTKIGLWGRSMGAATSLFYGQKDPSVAALVLDSPFCKLTDLMQELVDTFGADRGMHVPRPLVRGAVALLRFTIKRKAKFDIADLDVSAAAAGSFVPALFGHGTGARARVLGAFVFHTLCACSCVADALRALDRRPLHLAGAQRGALRRLSGTTDATSSQQGICSAS
jgi:pimeloyl-ACP methyl ester carboxylesterase